MSVMLFAELALAAIAASSHALGFEETLAQGRREVLAAHQERASGLLRLQIENTADFVAALDAEAFRLWEEVFVLGATAKQAPAGYRERLAAAGVRAENLAFRVEGALRRAAAIAEVTPKDIEFAPRVRRLTLASASLRSRLQHLTADTGWDIARSGFKAEADALNAVVRRAWKSSIALDGKAAVILSRLR